MENKSANTNSVSGDVNAFPSLTWNHLHINHGHLDGSIDSGIDFTLENVSNCVEVKKIPLADFHPPVDVATQAGNDFDSKVEGAAKSVGIYANLVTVKNGCPANPPLIFTFSPDGTKNQAAETIVHAESGTTASLVFVYLGGDGDGLFGHRIRICCEENSKLDVSTVNLLGKGMVHYNSVGAVLSENSSFALTQVDLGASQTVTGSRIVLDGHGAESTVRNGYFMTGERGIDINYIAQHKGGSTKSASVANGVLDGKSKKAWRGTIDFVKGCVDSVGDEQEGILLLGRETVNKSMPVILCGEESVDGRHGSTIGRLNEDELLYFETRGIDRETARNLMIRSKINAVARNVPDENVREKIQNYLEGSL